MLVYSNSVEGKDDEYQAWYDKHVSDLTRVEGFLSAQRFVIDSERSEPPGDERKYLVVYELDTDVPTALANLRAAANSGAVERPDIALVKDDIYSQVFTAIRAVVVGETRP